MSLLNRLNAALTSRDPDLVGATLDDGFREGFPPESTTPLSDLLLAAWHYRHEDIARILQSQQAPESVPALAEAALQKHDYLAYNHSQALARKCIWALADIGTTPARSALEGLSQVPDETIAGYARRRLHLWSEELPRKRPISPP